MRKQRRKKQYKHREKPQQPNSRVLTVSVTHLDSRITGSQPQFEIDQIRLAYGPIYVRDCLVLIMEVGGPGLNAGSAV